MSSSRRGNGISPAEVTNIGAHGFWFLEGGCEYFVPFKDYPEFKAATVSQIHAMRRAGPGQFHWPDLDIDIEAAALEKPESFPMRFKRGPAKPRTRAASRAR